MNHHPARARVARIALAALLAACDDAPPGERPPPPEHDGIHGFANGCFVIDAAAPGSVDARFLEPDEDGGGYQFSGLVADAAARFVMRPADLGTYLFFDHDGRYLVAAADDSAAWALRREPVLQSDILLLDDSYVSPAEWDVEVSIHDPLRFQLRHRATGRYLSTTGLAGDAAGAAVVTFYPSTECAAFPELTLDAHGEVQPRAWDDGTLFGIVETHAHLFTNFGFGGGGIFHGSAFHRLGVEHALPSCEPYHGPDGRADLVGFTSDTDTDIDADALVTMFLTGLAPEFNHHTDGYPEFTDWPSSWSSSTHQTMYYRWIERAWLAGLRLLVQHATGNSVLCDVITATGMQDVRYSCNDMVAVDRTIDEVYALERYVDAQSGGPGRGWFRVVTTPAEARQVISEGRLAVLLGIEISNLFDCFLTTPEGFATCDDDTVREQLDRYYERGVRAIFPVHKYDNAFSAGDGHRNIVELGNFINTGHYSNFVEDCPDVPTVFDRGRVAFGGLNRPREDYAAPPAVDMSGFTQNPLGTLLPFLADIQGPPLEGEWCQNSGLTPLGETLIREMMLRGMIVEVDHLPRRAYARAFELLVENDYPAAGTHGNTNNGLIFRLGGISNTGLGRCSEPGRPGAMLDGLRGRVEQIVANGGYPAIGFGFDFNGIAGGPRPRFGEHSRCSTPQENPLTYPFQSYAGDVTFEEPHLGARTVDWNTEGMIHFGLLPELIQDARIDGATDEDLEPLFRSAEGYVRMWELAEERAAALR
jgi:microsomal dipeptidase-like Zn-dependent dipeptidase